MYNIPKEFYNSEDSDNKCFLCNKPKYRHHRKVENFGFPVLYQQCQCGIIKQTPMPNEKFFSWFFNSDIFYKSKEKSQHIWGYYDYFKDESSRMSTSKLRYKKLKRKLKFGNRLSIMKIGPSTGTFLYIAKQDGNTVLGCDISDKFVDYAKKQYDLDIDIGRFEHQNYQDNSFDMILLFNVIENVPNLDEFINTIYQKIKPGGYFIFNHVPMDNNFLKNIQKEKYFMYRPPICYMFTNSSIKLLAKKYGFHNYISFIDIRYMTLEKILSLLNLKYILKIISKLRIHRIPFPIWAYPSRITVLRVDK